MATMGVLFFSLLVLTKHCSASLSDYTKLAGTDITPCASPCIRVGNCGNYAPNPDGPCNITLIAELCDATCGCVAFNSNGWLKGCGNESCGITFESAQVDSYVKDNGVPAYPSSLNVPAIDDVHYPPEEPIESQEPLPSVLQLGSNWVLLANTSSHANISVGETAFNVVFLGVVSPDDSSPMALLERTFARWGFISACSVTGGEVARLRKGTGLVFNLTMPNFLPLLEADCNYYTHVYGNATDYIGLNILNETNGEATFLDAAKYLPPQRDYASIGGVWPYQKYSVSPDGRIKTADNAIYTPTATSNSTGPGVLVFDPATYLPVGHWPATNWTYIKSALVGSHLRIVSTIGYDNFTTHGFEQIAFAPASEPAASVYVRLRGTVGPDVYPLTYQYINVSVNASATPLSPQAFYQAMLDEQTLWNDTFSHGAQYSIPGQEGARQMDIAYGAVVASASLFVGLQPNYGDGQDYWSPQVDRGGSLPFQTIALDQALLDLGLVEMASDRVGWWMDNYITPTGNISTGDWEDSCPNQFADGLADYGEMQDLFARVARAMVAIGSTAWVEEHTPQMVLVANYSYNLRLAAKARGEIRGVNVTAGLIFGSPEHDTCHEPDYYYHNNAWFIRGMLEMGKFLRDVCPYFCPSYADFGLTLLNEAASFQADFQASLNLSMTFVNGSLFFIPPIASLNYAPFGTMIESTVAEYSNFRYYSELLGANILTPEQSVALQDFRESHTGTVSGITRWSDHLDDMPSSYYLAASLRDDRIERFLLLQYGHMANYMGRGTWTATEQLPMFADSLGFFRDYLWSYLEGGIDQCIPSIMLSSIGSRWQMVLEMYDMDTIWVAKGAPRRWYDPSSGGFGITRAFTRYGYVSVSIANTQSSQGQDTLATVQYVPSGVPGITQTPEFAVRLRSSNFDEVLQVESVVLDGLSVKLVSVDAATEIAYVAVTESPGVGDPLTFTLAASFLPA